jgi:deoxyadenosine/deoxycytidine kinase
MAKTVEFIGPRGVGKSTLYNAVIKELTQESTCAGVNAFFPYVDMRKKGVLGKIEFFIRKVLKKELKDQRALQVSGYQFIQAHQELCAYAWEMIDKYQQSDFNQTDNRFRAAYNLYNNFLKHKLVESSDLDKYCLTGEGIVHSALLIFPKNYDVSDLATFLGHLPLPRAVIYCEATPEILAERCLQRRTVVSQMHKSKSQLIEDAKDELDLYQQILSELSLKGIEILRVDTACSIDENKKLISEFIKDIEFPSQRIVQANDSILEQVQLSLLNKKTV